MRGTPATLDTSRSRAPKFAGFKYINSTTITFQPYAYTVFPSSISDLTAARTYYITGLPPLSQHDCPMWILKSLSRLSFCTSFLLRSNQFPSSSCFIDCCGYIKPQRPIDNKNRKRRIFHFDKLEKNSFSNLKIFSYRNNNEISLQRIFGGYFKKWKHDTK